MAKSRIQWNEEEEMMARAYENIAYSMSFIASFMKNHVKTVKNGMGIINDGDMGEMLDKLADMINENLHNVSQKRISITTGDIAPKSVVPPEPSSEQPSGWNSTSTDGKNRQFESKTNKNMKKKVVKINENTLRQIVAESVKKVLKEGEFDDNYKTCLQHISAALEAIKEIWKGEDNGYDANSEYTRQYNDMLGQLHTHLRNAFFVAKELAANGREGDFDTSGYHTAGF